MKPKVLIFFLAIIVALMTITIVFADDGAIVLKSMSHQKKPTVRNYVDEAEHAFIQMMKFYVPAQAANGTVAPVDYYNADESLVETRDFAKPLIGAFIFGPSEGVDGVGFVGHGRRDAYGAVSLDDGMTWKKTNLSESSDLTSCDGGGGDGGCSVERRDIKLFKDTKYAYPGDVVNIFHAVAGNKVLVAWPSRYCQSGQPNYSLDQDEYTDDKADLLARREAIADYLEIDLETASPEALYLVDMYGVGGQQGSVNYEEDKFEQNHVVGEVPFNCLWTARGVLVQGDDPRTDSVEEASYMRWFKAERLTSGRRDVNRIETKCVEGAGCAITWQEDPKGLRPGQGEGPGEGWSGAIANSQTDIWYSYIDWINFDVVQDPADDTGATPMLFLDYEAAADGDITQKPKPFVPFAMPMRLTDNAKCNVDNPQPYCIGDALVENFLEPPDLEAYGLRDMCADTVQIPTGPQGTPADVCVTEDGMPLVGNTASTRPRLGLFGYDGDGDGSADSAFVVVEAEEDKGLGAFGFTDDTSETASPCDPEVDEGCIAFDEGKNLWYFSFSMSLSDALTADALDGLPANLGSHGNMLNQPEVDWETGKFYPERSTEFMWNFVSQEGKDYNYYIHNTEIARRGSLLAQDIAKAEGSTSRLIALPAWKQGIMNQGGPADVMVRRIILPTDWTLENDGNPYAFRNMACESWIYNDGSNPMYPDGLCLDSAINLSATIPDTCIDSATGEEGCPIVDFSGISDEQPFPIGDTNPILQGNPDDPEFVPNTDKVLTWHQCPAEFTTVSGETLNCDTDARTDDSTLADQSWYNPLDVSKGHRGFLDGDFVMVLYAWSPTWRLNAKGSDRYELYIRRSFDGAATWTTTPGDLGGDGTVTCETFRSTETGAQEPNEPRVCNSYVEGAAEQARNVTQHKSMRITTLDPRYAATAGTIEEVLSEELAELGFLGSPGYNLVSDDTTEDERDPSRFFIVYETGDNTTTAEGEPEPLDLFYSRAVNYGDDYVVWAAEEDETMYRCYPSDPHDQDVPEELIESGFCNEFDQLEQGKPELEASEASLAANPGGEFLYGVWAQMLFVEQNKNKTVLEESDAMARRVWWIDDFTPDDAWIFGQGPQLEKTDVDRQPLNN